MGGVCLFVWILARALKLSFASDLVKQGDVFALAFKLYVNFLRTRRREPRKAPQK
jgi:hypothetical protein